MYVVGIVLFCLFVFVWLGFLSVFFLLLFLFFLFLFLFCFCFCFVFCFLGGGGEGGRKFEIYICKGLLVMLVCDGSLGQKLIFSKRNLGYSVNILLLMVEVLANLLILTQHADSM